MRRASRIVGAGLRIRLAEDDTHDLEVAERLLKERHLDFQRVFPRVGPGGTP
jgi:hypothetical protein